jgi:hypothetical protein
MFANCANPMMPLTFAAIEPTWVVAMPGDRGMDYDLFKFRRFRLNVLGFLRLPLDTSEAALRQAIEASSSAFLADYLWRAELCRRTMSGATQKIQLSRRPEPLRASA